MKFTITIILTSCLFGSVSSQNVCQQTIETYTVLLLKMPMPSADNTKEQNKFVFDNRKKSRIFGSKKFRWIAISKVQNGMKKRFYFCRSSQFY